MFFRGKYRWETAQLFSQRAFMSLRENLLSQFDVPCAGWATQALPTSRFAAIQ